MNGGRALIIYYKLIVSIIILFKIIPALLKDTHLLQIEDHLFIYSIFYVKRKSDRMLKVMILLYPLTIAFNWCS